MGITDTGTDAQDRADMERLAGGQDAALNLLLERHAQRVFQFLFRMLGHEEDANDLAQETFVRVYQHRADFKPGARFSTWLYTIAANLARNQLRWRARHPNVPITSDTDNPGQALESILPADQPTPSQQLVAAERTRLVREAVRALPDDLREAVVLCEWEEMAVAEAATVLATTPKAVESRLYRARQALRERLKPWL